MQTVEHPHDGVKFLFNGGIWEAILENLDRADDEILMVFPWITYDDLVDKLIELKNKKPTMKIKILTGINPQSNDSHKESVLKLDGAGIQIRTIYKPFPHAKVICVDRKVLTTGSMNASFSAAQRNFECALMTSSRSECDRFCEFFSTMWHEALFHGANLSTTLAIRG